MKCLKWHQLDPYLLNETFECSSGWISDALKRNGLTSLKLHGKANEMTLEQELEEMGPWLVRFHTLIQEKDTPPECVYNSDQAGVYYHKKHSLR